MQDTTRHPAPAAPASAADTRQDAQSKAFIALGLTFMFFLALFAGYTFGKDLAIKHNHQDCMAEGRADCSRG